MRRIGSLAYEVHRDFDSAQLFLLKLRLINIDNGWHRYEPINTLTKTPRTYRGKLPAKTPELAIWRYQIRQATACHTAHNRLHNDSQAHQNIRNILEAQTLMESQ